MTLKIDGDALKTVIENYFERKVAEEAREFLVYGLPADFHPLYKAYLDEVERKRLVTEHRAMLALNFVRYAAAAGLIVIGFVGLLK
ncbi:MAG: hypothetical protein ACO223_12165 [Burkholderiaceae bacterium]